MISVLIPARDEAASIGGVIRRVREALSAEPHEIITIDDGSTDGTGAQAKAAGAQVLTLDGRGYGAAIKAGARQARGGLIALIDADGSYPEEALPLLLGAIRSGARQAIGARPALSRAEPVARAAIKGLFRSAVRVLGGKVIPDLNSGLRIIYRQDLLALEPVLPDRFSLTTTLTLALASQGDPVAFVPITYRPREGQSKWRAIRDTWLMGRTVLRGIFWLRQGRAPRALPLLHSTR